MSTVTIEEAQTNLPELIDRLKANEEIFITKDDRTVARLIGTSEPAKAPRQPGTLKGTVTYMAPDFDAPLDESGPPAVPFGQPVPGRCAGMLTVIAEDDEHLKDWTEYITASSNTPAPPAVRLH